MSENRLFIARHGETEYNRKGLLQGRGINAPLNKTGIKQAQYLSEYLQSYDTNFLACSSLLRAEETAGYYSRDSDLPIVKNSNLDEMDFGNFEGAPFSEVIREIQELDNAWRGGDLSVQVPGGESPVEVLKRANEAIRSYLDSRPGETLVMVVHGRLIRILLSEWLGYGLKNMHMIEHKNGAVNQLIHKNGQFEAVYLNKTEHLKEFNY